MPGLRIACTAALLSAIWIATASAQDPSLPVPASGPPPANLAFVEGEVDLVHEGVAERAAAGTMLLDGDAVRTRNGRAEIVFGDGTLLHLDRDTDLEILTPDRLRLRNGRLLLRVSAAAPAPYVVDTQSAAATLHPRGEYGLKSDDRVERFELTVARGMAELDEGGGRAAVVRAGEMASILGAGGRVLLQAFNSARWDAFERWASDRSNGFPSTASARQLPVELRPYGPVLDSYGRWDYVAPHGFVWFPSVGVSWRPYYTGAWRMTRFGRTWFGHDPWAWPTHHYGRWGFTGAAWYWIPHRVWGPAWVSWTFVPGYVSWCPLGWDGRPVLAFRHGRGRPGDHPAYWPNYDPWRAWTIMPRDAFNGRRSVRAHAVDPVRLPDDTRRAINNVAVARGSFAAPAAGGLAPNADLAVPHRGTVSTPGNRRDDDPTDARRRGAVRAAQTPAPPRPPVTAASGMLPSPSTGAVRRRPGAAADESDASAGPRGTQPRGDAPRGEWSRRPGADAPARDDGAGRAEPAPRVERPNRAERPQSREGPPAAERGDSGSGRRSGGVAVPRSPGGQSRGGASQGGASQGGVSQGGSSQGGSRQGGSVSGGARRRPG